MKPSVVRDNPELMEQDADLSFIELLHQQVAQERGPRNADRLAIAQTARCGQEHADVVGGVEYLRHAALDVEHCVDSLHRRAHGVLGGEDTVALFGFRELADEGEVD